MFNEDIISFAI